MTYRSNEGCYYTSLENNVVLNGFNQEPQQVQPQGVKKRDGDCDQSREEIVKDMAIIMSGFHCKYLFDIDYISHRDGSDAVKVVNLE